MKKTVVRLIMALLILAMAISAFAACKTIETYSVSFVNDEDSVTDAMTVAQAQEYLKSLPTREGYVFKGWYLDKDVWQQEIKSTEDIDKYIQSGNVNVYARWLPIVDAITILFLDYNKASLLEYQCDRADVNLNFLKPTAKPNDEKYTYTFDHWECDMSDLSQAYYTATPVYNAALRVFDVKYYDQGKLIYTEKVEYGKDTSASRVKPEKRPSTDQYDYTFVGWEGVTTNITSDISLNAIYQDRVRQYKVEFNFGDDNKDTQNISYGESATAPQNTQKSSTAQYKYDFIGWDNSFDNIKSDTVVNAIYSSQLRVYEVSFWIDDKCIQSTKELYGAMAVAPTSVVKVENDGYIYEFKGWDKSFVGITGNTKVNAIFERHSQMFDVNYIDWNGDLLYSESVETSKRSVYMGETPQRESNPQFEYKFTGWSDSEKLSDVRVNLTVYAQYEEIVRNYSVKFVYGDDNEDIQSIEYGKAAIAPLNTEKSDTAQYRYEFIGWDNVFNNIQADTVVNAKYSTQVQVYEVSFWVDDKCIKSTNELYGASAVAPTSVAKVENDGFIYEFKEWDNTFDFISADTKVNAIFEKHSQTFDIRYIDWNGKLLYTDQVESGQKSVFVGETPQRESNPQFEYKFTGWSDSEKLKNVVESFEVYAQYAEQIRKYTVTFAYGSDKTTVFENVEYGSSLIGQEPVDTFKESTAKYDFTFVGWLGYVGYVSSDMTITALYTETIRRYVVKFVNDGEVVRAQEVAYDDFASAPSVVPIADNAQYNYTFIGWAVVDNPFVSDENDFQGVDISSTPVVGEITYTAVYLRKIQRYTVAFFNEQVIGERVMVAQIEVDYGTDATLLGPTVTRDKTQAYEYTFSGWSKDLTFISTNVEVDAQYTQELRTYTVTFYNDGEVYATEYVKYGFGVENIPANPTKQSTVQYDFVFERWVGGDINNIYDDTDMNASYLDILRKYRVTFFDLSVYELISTVELYYGETISTKIERDGYYFDAWYRDPDCTTMFNTDTEFVDGIMMLFGNTVINGIEYKESTEGLVNKKTIGVITGYSGTLANVILPRVIKGLPMTKIAKEAFANNEVMESIYIPDSYTTVEAYIFKNIEELDIYTQVKGLGTLDYPAGWNSWWNSNNGVIDSGSSKRLVTNNVDNIVTSGDYRYILIGGDKNTAVIDKFVNNNTTRAYIEATLGYQKPSFASEEHVDEKTGQKRNIYTISYEEKNYDITTISQSAFSGCKNLSSVFIPKTITSVKKYAFSGITANLYIQYKQSDVALKWNISWNANRSGDEGERTVYWEVIGMDQIGDFTYIFKADKTAIAAEFNGTTTMLSTVTIPTTVSYRSADDADTKVDYTVTELGDELFADGMNSLLSFKSITLPERLEKIGSKVFYMNGNLSSITLPETLKEIGSYAFVGTMGLKEIFIPAATTKIGTFCFAGSSATIYMGREKKAIDTGLGLYWNIKLEIADIQKLTSLAGFAGLVFSPTYLPTYWNVAGKYTDVVNETARKSNFEYILYNDGTACLVSYSSAGMAHAQSYAIPKTLTVNEKTYTVNAIGESALSGNTAITSIFIPSTVTSIGANAFAGCKNLTIKTAFAESEKPSGWDSAFNPDDREIIYGAQ